MGVAIEGTVASKIGFASYQNAAPILRELTISNDAGIDHDDLVVELTNGLPFLEPKHWRIDRHASWVERAYPGSRREAARRLSFGAR